MFICHPWKAAALRIRVTHSLSRCNVSINALSAIVCTCIAPLYFLPLHQCTVPLLCTIVHCTAVLFAIALFHCNYAPFHWNVSFDHCTVSINAHSALASSSIAIAIVALLSRIIISTNIAIYIHYPNIHYQNVARSIIKPIINTYIYALQSVDKSIQAQFWIFGQKLGFHTSEKLLHFYHLTFVGWPLLQNVRDSFFYCLTPHREIIAMDQKPDLSNYKKYYDTVVCCDTYCHKLQMNNVYERCSLYFNDTSNTFHVSGFPQPQYRWLKDGDYISGFSSEHFYKVWFLIW